MRIIYMHHAERQMTEKHNDPILRQEEDITENGIKDAELIAEKLKTEGKNVKAIVTSPYIRCTHTAEIVNKYINVPIIYDDRFNEWQPGEDFEQVLRRNMSAIDDVVNKYDKDDDIICVTSGVNFTAFVCYFYGIEPSNNTPLSQGFAASPINFYTKMDK